MIISNGALVSVPTSALGDLTPMFNQGSYYASGAGLGQMTAFGKIYSEQLWVGIVIRKLAMATARNPFDVKRQLEGTEQEPEAGNLSALLASPNEHMSGFDLWEWTSSTYDIYGEAFWLKLRGTDGRVRELHPVHPTNITAHRNERGELIYRYGSAVNASGQPIEWPAADVVVFKNYNPDNIRRGLSNLEGLRMTLLNEDASRRANAAWWRNGARPSLVLKHPKNLSDAAVTRLRKQIEGDLSGADNMGRVLVVEEAMEPTTVQLSAEEMQYIEGRKLNREEVCSAYDVPPPVVHILDKATFSNITEQLRSMYRDTMAPRFEKFESVVDSQLVPDFYPDRDVFTKFNMDEVLRGDFETRATAVTSLIQTGVVKPSEARPMFGLPRAGDEADQLFANAALLPLSAVAAQQPRQPGGQQVATDGTLIPTPVQRAIEHTREARSAAGRRGRVKAKKTAARDKLVTEHVDQLESFFEIQRDSVVSAASSKASGVFDPADWDEPLAEILGSLSTATAKVAGGATAASLGATYDPSTVQGWIDSDATDSAKRINRTTADQIDAALDSLEDDDDPADTLGRLFDEGQTSTRATEIATSRVASVMGFAAIVAGQQAGQQLDKQVTKTWNTESGNPRSAHAAMDGETVGIDELFSNGMNAPGDPAGGADEVAGCMCGITINVT
ncbi:phage portal protein [Rathayibacter sp. Leaf248]|uniref:phage portal protein n=1 Tax=Rathayibacter sp. Leaf248 TaxID=2876555 RepID=UPI001E4E8BDC|nr:phage portal protein [Rathayibacter sp. Leaf248]